MGVVMNFFANERAERGAHIPTTAETQPQTNRTTNPIVSSILTLYIKNAVVGNMINCWNDSFEHMFAVCSGAAVASYQKITNSEPKRNGKKKINE